MKVFKNIKLHKCKFSKKYLYIPDATSLDCCRILQCNLERDIIDHYKSEIIKHLPKGHTIETVKEKIKEWEKIRFKTNDYCKSFIPKNLAAAYFYLYMIFELNHKLSQFKVSNIFNITESILRKYVKRLRNSVFINYVLSPVNQFQYIISKKTMK